MNLLDGLNYYKQCSDSDWHFTVRVESSAVEVLKMISPKISFSYQGS
jgi:hypothetical protein